jgi:hypothetical protein
MPPPAGGIAGAWYLGREAELCPPAEVQGWDRGQSAVTGPVPPEEGGVDKDDGLRVS